MLSITPESRNLQKICIITKLVIGIFMTNFDCECLLRNLHCVEESDLPLRHVCLEVVDELCSVFVVVASCSLGIRVFGACMADVCMVVGVSSLPWRCCRRLPVAAFPDGVRHPNLLILRVTPRST